MKLDIGIPVDSSVRVLTNSGWSIYFAPNTWVASWAGICGLGPYDRCMFVPWTNIQTVEKQS